MDGIFILKYMIWLLFSLLLIGQLSCNVISTTVAPDLTATLPPVGQGLSLTDTAISETYVSPAYSLSALVPVMAGITDLQSQLVGFLP